MLTSCSVCSCWREKLCPPLKKKRKKLPCLDDQSWPHTRMFPNQKRGLCVILSLPSPFYGTSEVGCFDVSHLTGHLHFCFETITHLASPFLVWVSADVFRFGLGTWRMQEGKHSRSLLGPWQAWAYYTELHPGGEKWDVLVHSRMSPEDGEDPGCTNPLFHTDSLTVSKAVLTKTEKCAKRAWFSHPLQFTGPIIKTRLPVKK